MEPNAATQTKSVASLCLEVAKATVHKPASPGGATLAGQLGGHLADKLAEELASMLTAVLPAAVAQTIGDDLLEGAENIAAFLYGNADDRRKVYHLAQTSKIPVFRMGAVICARKSVLLRWIAEQEGRAA